jgi:ribosome maturation factor RimP
MDKALIEKTVEKIAYPIVEELGYDLVDVEFVKENNEWYLRVYIDKENGITLDDCTKVSRLVEDKIDEIDPIDCSYYLEVSSPGLDRPLKKDSDFIKFAGRNIKIKLYKPLEGKKVIEGVLKGLENDSVLVLVNDDIIKLDRSLIASARLNDF